jgi:hypothetical protein
MGRFRRGSNRVEPAQAPCPVVVELFTSQGCSSCPSADAVLGRLAERGDVITLALHVDYWDNLGWADPYSQRAFTERQLRYAQVFGLRSIYTPQAVLNGRAECVGSDARRVAGYIEQEASRAPTGSLQLSASLGSDHRAPITIDVSTSGVAGARLAVVFGVYERGLENHVPRGENAGRTLDAGFAVRSLVALPLSEATARSFEIALEAGWSPASLGVAAFVQDLDSMAIGPAAAVSLAAAGASGPAPGSGAPRLAPGRGG